MKHIAIVKSYYQVLASCATTSRVLLGSFIADFQFMQLQSIDFEMYKTFPSPQKFIIRPITIVIGKNSSGKSALSRIPLLLANSFSTDADEPITVNHEGVEFGGSFTDLLYNRYPHGSIKMTLAFLSNTTISFEVQNISGTPIQLIKNWSIKSPLIDLSLEIELSSENVKRTENIIYKSHSTDYLVTFKGLVPISIVEKDGRSIDMSVLDSIAADLHVFSRGVEYIGPYRQIPSRIYFNSGKFPSKLGVKGENAPQILGTSSYRDAELVKSVGDWYAEFMGGWRIDVLQTLNSFEIVLVSPDDPSVNINIVDVGQGMSQILPLVVRCKSKSRAVGAISIVEQPELHLHPAAHGDLAEMFAHKALEEKSSYILETHSENIILRIRRLVVEKTLRPEDVIIYWIDDDERPGSTVKEIYIDSDGDISDWPKGVFSEDLEEVLAIRKAQREKNDSANRG